MTGKSTSTACNRRGTRVITSIRFDEATFDYLRAHADRLATSVAAVVRDAVATYFAAQKPATTESSAVQADPSGAERKKDTHA